MNTLLKRGLVTLLAACLLASGGCLYKDPTIAVRSASVTDRTDAATIVTFVVDATNPNEIPLPLRRLDYSVDINGSRVFSGVRSPEATLAPGETRSLSFPAVVPAGSAAALAGNTYALRGTITYTTPGQIAERLFETGVSRPTVSFSQSGSIDAAK